MKGFRTLRGAVAAPPFTNGPYTMSEFVAFNGGMSGANTSGNCWFVDGTNGLDTNDGKSWKTAKITIQAAITAASGGDTIYIAAMAIAAGATDPGSYAENLIIPATNESLSLIGVTRGRTQGGLPQIKVGGTVASSLLTIRSSGCLIANLGFNGNSTAGAPLNVGILLDDDGSTKSAFGTTILGCHFKNCCGSTVTDARTGGAITWSAQGNAWQVLISGNRFYKNVCDISLLGTSGSVPQDVIIEDNIFSGPTDAVDSQLFLKGGGSGMNGVHVRNNIFPCLGTLSSAVLKRMADMTGCVGTFTGNMIGSATGASAGFKAAGAIAYIPATVFMSGNYAEDGVVTRQT